MSKRPIFLALVFVLKIFPQASLILPLFRPFNPKGRGQLSIHYTLLSVKSRRGQSYVQSVQKEVKERWNAAKIKVKKHRYKFNRDPLLEIDLVISHGYKRY